MDYYDQYDWDGSTDYEDEDSNFSDYANNDSPDYYPDWFQNLRENFHEGLAVPYDNFLPDSKFEARVRLNEEFNKPYPLSQLAQLDGSSLKEKVAENKVVQYGDLLNVLGKIIFISELWKKRSTCDLSKHPSLLKLLRREKSCGRITIWIDSLNESVGVEEAETSSERPGSVCVGPVRNTGSEAEGKSFPGEPEPWDGTVDGDPWIRTHGQQFGKHGLDHVLDNDQNIADNDQNIAVNGQNIADSDQNIADNGQNIPDNDQNITNNDQNIADNGQNIADNDQNIADNGQNIADNDQNIANNDQNIADNDQNIADNDQNIADNGQNIVDNGQNIADNEQNIADNDQNIADNGQNIADNDQYVEDLDLEGLEAWDDLASNSSPDDDIGNIDIDNNWGYGYDDVSEPESDINNILPSFGLWAEHIHFPVADLPLLDQYKRFAIMHTALSIFKFFSIFPTEESFRCHIQKLVTMKHFVEDRVLRLLRDCLPDGWFSLPDEILLKIYHLATVGTFPLEEFLELDMATASSGGCAQQALRHLERRYRQEIFISMRSMASIIYSTLFLKPIMTPVDELTQEFTHLTDMNARYLRNLKNLEEYVDGEMEVSEVDPDQVLARNLDNGTYCVTAFDLRFFRYSPISLPSSSVKNYDKFLPVFCKNHINIFNLELGRFASQLDGVFRGLIQDCSIDPDNMYVVVLMINPRVGNMLMRLSADESFITDALTIWDIETGKLLARVQLDAECFHSVDLLRQDPIKPNYKSLLMTNSKTGTLYEIAEESFLHKEDVVSVCLILQTDCCIRQTDKNLRDPTSVMGVQKARSGKYILQQSPDADSYSVRNIFDLKNPLMTIKCDPQLTKFLLCASAINPDNVAIYTDELRIYKIGRDHPPVKWAVSKVDPVIRQRPELNEIVMCGNMCAFNYSYDKLRCQFQDDFEDVLIFNMNTEHTYRLATFSNRLASISNEPICNVVVNLGDFKQMFTAWNRLFTIVGNTLLKWDFSLNPRQIIEKECELIEKRLMEDERRTTQL